ncbi:hypothetical protein [Streptomyces sp. SID9727]|uniref:hypothetical protein n=1 Tax=Streptomyces sp. SID9727 TaxID=2706114 RepID=UPI0013C9A578|nr:hypothetical protein [Streptomyces sp. SID9727]NEC66137.1 hypothetical protein [Streptomyces sp. SID9727]
MSGRRLLGRTPAEGRSLGAPMRRSRSRPMLNDAGYLSCAEGYATARGRYGWDQTITGSY